MRFTQFFVVNNLPKPFKKEELNSYFEKMKLGDMAARDEIIKRNIRMVIHEAQKFSNTPYDLDELISVGIIGLIKSVDTFDTNKGILFATYSTRCINNEILLFLKKSQKYINDVNLEQLMGTNNEGNVFTIEDILTDINSDFVSEYIENESYKVIRKIVEQLPERDKIVIIRYFGFIDNQPKTQKEIAIELGITQSLVSQNIRKALNKVKIELEKQGIIEKFSKTKESLKQGEKSMAKKLQKE